MKRLAALTLVCVLWCAPAWASFYSYKTVTINHTQAGATDSTDFPLVINVTDAALKTAANGGYVLNANGYDIRPFSNRALTSALTYELVVYTATTGALEMHVKIPTLSHTADTVFYLAFGDASLTTNGSSTSTWDTYFKGVYHLKDGTTLSGVDATVNAATGTLTGTPTASAGVVDGAGTFNGSSQYVTMGDVTNFDFLTADFTVSGWVNPATSNTRDMIQSKDGSTRGWILILNSNSGGTNVAGQVAFSWSTDGVKFTNLDSASGLVSTVTWTYLSVSRSGGSMLLYKNGVSQTFTKTGTGAITDSIRDTNAAYELARRAIGGSFFDYFNGSLDEQRISSGIARSVDWELATYNSQKPSSTFLTFGVRQPVNTAFFLLFSAWRQVEALAFGGARIWADTLNGSRSRQELCQLYLFRYTS